MYDTNYLTSFENIWKNISQKCNDNIIFHHDVAQTH